LPSLNQAWPIAVGREQDPPDNVITIYNTTDKDEGRSSIDGEMAVHYGIQVRVRSDASNSELGYNKLNSILTAIDEEIYRVTVVIGSSTYLVESFSRTSGILSLGTEVGATKRYLFTLNALATLYQL
jgi:hypothetical protein